MAHGQLVPQDLSLAPLGPMKAAMLHQSNDTREARRREKEVLPFIRPTQKAGKVRQEETQQ